MSTEGPDQQNRLGGPQQGVQDEQTAPEQEYEGQAEGIEAEPDVLLDVPVLNVEEINLELQDLRAHISLRTELAGLVKINVGVDAYLNAVKLEIKGVEAQALLKVRLERILDTFDRALKTIDNNPEIVGELVRSASGALSDAEDGTERPGEDIVPDGAGGGRVRQTLDETGDVIESTLDASGNVVEESIVSSAEDGGGDPPNVTDAARKKAEELGVDLQNVEGTGSGGKVLVRDVQRAAAG